MRLVFFICSLFISPLALAGSHNSFINTLLSSTELEYSLGIIGAATLCLIFSSKKPFSRKYGPEILTTLGILGCFFGIALALLDFNSNDITNSVPALLQGIKTSFWSSIAGIGGALIVRIISSFVNRNENTSRGITASGSLSDIGKELKCLTNVLAGDEDGSLLSQIKMLRQDSNDSQKKLQSSFDNFAKHMTENNQKAVIKALQEVIKDFNEKLMEQFGDNFKQLNSAVEKLVTWQDQYKTQLEEIKEAQTQAANDMKVACDAFNEVVIQSRSFSAIAQDLGTLLDSLNKQNEILFTQEKALSELLSGMKGIVPEFSQQTKSMLDEITQGIQIVQSESAKLIKEYKSDMSDINTVVKRDISELIKGTQAELNTNIASQAAIIKETIEAVKSQTVDVIKNHGVALQSSQAEMKNILTTSMKQNQEDLSKGLVESSEIIKKGVLTLDRELEKSLNDSLTSLGKQLASLSEKFVADYTPLTNKLRDLIILANKVEA